MKRVRNIIYGILALASVGAVSCDNELATPPIPEPEGGIESIGTGAWDNPMSVYQARIGSVNAERPEVWVCGYIVGYCDVDISNTLSAESAKLQDEAAGCTVASNMLIAQTPDETNWENCATVQLSSGGARNALNLKDNPESLRQQVCVYGTTGTKYCGAYGVRGVVEYNMGDKGIQLEPEGPIDPLPYLWKTWDESDRMSTYAVLGWVNKEISGGLDGWYISSYNGNNYIAINARYGSTAGGPYENWLIAPPVDLSKSNSKTLSFTTQAAYPAEGCTLEVYVMDSNDVTTAKRTKLEADIATPPASGYSSWTQSGTIDLSAHNGIVYIGWRYYSPKGGDGNSSTFGIDRINIGGAPEVARGTIYSALNSTDTELSEGWTFDNVITPQGMTNVWSWTNHNGNYYLNGNARRNNQANESLSYAISPAIDLPADKQITMSFMHAARYQTTLRDLCGVVIRKAGTEEWTNLEIPVWPKPDGWVFVKSGDIDLSAWAGQKVQIAFRYQSSTEGADTWEVNNLIVKEK